MTDKPAETPKRDPNESPWYRLATLYGEPDPWDTKLHDRNRLNWSRYMARRLTDKERAKLIEKNWHSAEELTPFSSNEVEMIFTRVCKKKQFTRQQLDFISSQLLEHLPGTLKLVAAAQTVIGAVLLFLFGLALRNRF